MTDPPTPGDPKVPGPLLSQFLVRRPTESRGPGAEHEYGGSSTTGVGTEPVRGGEGLAHEKGRGPRGPPQVRPAPRLGIHTHPTWRILGRPPHL